MIYLKRLGIMLLIPLWLVGLLVVGIVSLTGAAYFFTGDPSTWIDWWSWDLPDKFRL